MVNINKLTGMDESSLPGGSWHGSVKTRLLRYQTGKPKHGVCWEATRTRMWCHPAKLHQPHQDRQDFFYWRQQHGSVALWLEPMLRLPSSAEATSTASFWSNCHLIADHFQMHLFSARKHANDYLVLDGYAASCWQSRTRPTPMESWLACWFCMWMTSWSVDVPLHVNVWWSEAIFSKVILFLVPPKFQTHPRMGVNAGPDTETLG